MASLDHIYVEIWNFHRRVILILYTTANDFDRPRLALELNSLYIDDTFINIYYLILLLKNKEK